MTDGSRGGEPMRGATFETGFVYLQLSVEEKIVKGHPPERIRVSRFPHAIFTQEVCDGSE
jgi:hypothetical protein